MDFKKMTVSELEARKAAIAIELDKNDADLDALEAEARGINEEIEARKAAEARRVELRKMVAGGDGVVARTFTERKEERSYGADSAEYRNAFLKNLLDQEMNVEERAAFTHMTTNTPAVLPATMLNNIWSLISTRHSIMGDITTYRTGTVIEVVKHAAIAQGDAKIVAEATANDDEQNTFVKVTLSGKDFSKHVDISYAMAKMSLESFESYLVNEIADRLGAAMAADVVAQIGIDMASQNKAEPEVSGSVSFEDVAALFALLDGADNVTIYAKRSTIYKHLVGMVDESGRPIFQPNAQAGASGTLLGATIKIEDAVADGVILAGDPSKFVYNMVQDIMVETDRDIKRHVITHSGYARGEGALIVPNAFAQLTV